MFLEDDVSQHLRSNVNYKKTVHCLTCYQITSKFSPLPVYLPLIIQVGVKSAKKGYSFQPALVSPPPPPAPTPPNPPNGPPKVLFC